MVEWDSADVLLDNDFLSVSLWCNGIFGFEALHLDNDDDDDDTLSFLDGAEEQS